MAIRELPKRYIRSVRSPIEDFLHHIVMLLTIVLPFGAAIVAVFMVNSRLPHQYQFVIPEQVGIGYFITVCGAAIFLCLLTLASVYVIRSCRNLDFLGEQFDYDLHGTLMKERDPNIAFRIPTFQRMLSSLSEELKKIDFNEDEIATEFYLSGRDAAQNFSKHISSIVDKRLPYDKKWKELNLRQKLTEWGYYDSVTGWGHFYTELMDNDVVRIRINHSRGLFSLGKGNEFSYFLSGYCETVLSSIIKEHPVTLYVDAKLEGSPKYSLDTVELHFRLIAS